MPVPITVVRLYLPSPPPTPARDGISHKAAARNARKPVTPRRRGSTATAAGARLPPSIRFTDSASTTTNRFSRRESSLTADRTLSNSHSGATCDVDRPQSDENRAVDRAWSHRSDLRAVMTLRVRGDLLENVAVGTALSGRPPHRSGRAELPHPAPASDQTTSRWFGYG